MCKKVKLKAVKKLHELQQKAFEQKLDTLKSFGVDFFKEVAPLLFPKVSANPQESPLPNLGDDVKSLIGSHFKMRDGWFMCVGKNIDLIINDDILYFAAKKDPQLFSTKIGHIQLMDFATLDGCIGFILNA
jgi:hypothetical protein